MRKSTIGMVFVAALIAAPTVQADDGQVFLRYLGHGWGAGYHSFPPRGNEAARQPVWVRGPAPCLDRYSRPNFPGPLTHCLPDSNAWPVPTGGRYHWTPEPAPYPYPQAVPAPGWQAEPIGPSSHSILPRPVPGSNPDSATSPRAPQRPAADDTLPEIKSLDPPESTPAPQRTPTPNAPVPNAPVPNAPVPNAPGTQQNPFGFSHHPARSGYQAPTQPDTRWLEATARPASRGATQLSHPSARYRQPVVRPPYQAVPQPGRPTNTFNGIR